MLIAVFIHESLHAEFEDQSYELKLEHKRWVKTEDGYENIYSVSVPLVSDEAGAAIKNSEYDKDDDALTMCNVGDLTDSCSED